MFTGIVETTGTLLSIERRSKSVHLGIQPAQQPFAVELGGSVAVDGVCLTLDKTGNSILSFTAVAETLSRTTLSQARVGTQVNLERALRADGRLDGHMVLGHVDAVGRILSDKPVGDSLVRTFEIPAHLHPLLASKGSIAIDGVSLTIVDSSIESVSVSLIPFTRGKTTATAKRPGDAVNIECDVLARYIFHMLHLHGGRDQQVQTRTNLQTLLERSGF